jgi:hypothetical protein
MVSLKPTRFGILVDIRTFKDLLINVTMKTGVTALLMLIILSSLFLAVIVRNKIVHNEWQIRETIEFIMFEQPPQAPKLTQVTFPIKIIDEVELQKSMEYGIGISQGCAICLEEFSVGHHARILPCRHAFHDTW